MQMAKKQDTEVVEDVCVFAEDHVMHQWSREQTPRDQIQSSRSRPMSRAKRGHEGKFHIPYEIWPNGFMLGWMVEYVLNVPQNDNLHERVLDGWEFVNANEIPQLKMVELNHDFDRSRSDGRIRRGGCILMKKPMEMYLEEQEEHRIQGEEIRKESGALTEYLSNGRDPRNVVVDERSYQPAHRSRGR